MERALDIGKRIEGMGRSAALLGAWAVIAGALSIALNGADAVDGTGWAISRVALGLIGLVAGTLLWSGRTYGKDGLYAIMAWGVLQIPYYASEPGGNITKQLFDAFLGATSQTRINGELTSYSQVGLNLAGVAVVIWASTCRGRLDLWRRRSLSPAA